MGAVTTTKTQWAGKIQANFSPEKHIQNYTCNGGTMN